MPYTAMTRETAERIDASLAEQSEYYSALWQRANDARDYGTRDHASRMLSAVRREIKVHREMSAHLFA